MTASIRRLPRAEEDLTEIWLYIARDNITAADSLLDKIDERIRRLASHPQIGQARPDIGPSVRILSVDRYVILYRSEGRDVEVVRVVHGARDLQTL